MKLEIHPSTIVRNTSTIVRKTLCPFCENETAEVVVSYDGRKFCHCDNCGEEFIPSWMMDYNVEIIRKKKQGQSIPLLLEESIKCFGNRP